MPLGTLLDIAEVASVLAFRKVGKSINEIAKVMGRSRCAVRHVLQAEDPFNRPPKKRTCPKMSVRSLRRLRKAASTSGKSASKLKTELQLDASVRTVQRHLKSTPWLQYMKRKQTPKLTERHMKARIAHATKHLKKSPKWKRIIWSDEKKFNLDGPDGFKYYWHDLRLEDEKYLSRQKGGGGIMVWGAFCSKGKAELAVLTGKQNAEAYITTLSDYLLPFGHSMYDPTFKFMQDGASIHTAKVTKAFLAEQDITIFDHPSLSPDLNPIENLWGDLSRAVYSEGRQYDNVRDLTSAVMKAWDEIPLERLKTLSLSMKSRCVEVILNRGAMTHY